MVFFIEGINCMGGNVDAERQAWGYLKSPIVTWAGDGSK